MGKRTQLLMWVAGISLVLSTVPFWLFESGTNDAVSNFFDAIWWWFVTATTLGYGDVYPLTAGGRIVAIFTIITGFFLYTNFVTIIAESVHAYLERRTRGTAFVEARDHLVICEYTAVADELIQSLPRCKGFEDKQVVIISDLVGKNPYPKHSFVCGVPINPASLKQASISKASHVFIFANLRFADPDVKTMHVAHRVRKENPTARIYVELVDPDNDLMEFGPKDLVRMKSRDLMTRVLRDEPIDPNDWV